ncbi:hypothetical protein LOZ57_006370 [Ophidiomyces ophidiicola]|uniref:uncharacterized protein n=1 Tax=Ophidiomyces ophidiicola TaxID=1387563 RepID=UPI0020C381A4|nr:uncharacterized protein LOZ57_006370 [Ophidiomyces ophidiicola]KAI1938301.1 hypothetical protein LOZ57_006370 [Ophidiomyces ophidiicola]KAI2051223.1 hypothetical protein LOZ43_004803 [Ophidiomyces ophidiicola]
MASRKRQMTRRDAASDDDDEERPQIKKMKPVLTAKSSSTDASKSKTDTNGELYWEISRQRRVTVSSFRGKTMINIREYYEKDGQHLPGKKGISLTLEQFNALIGILPDLEDAVRQKGDTIDRPEYCSLATNNNDDDEMQEVGGEHVGDKNKVTPEKNIEATSEEDS